MRRNWDWYVALLCIFLGVVGLTLVNNHAIWNSVVENRAGSSIASLFPEQGGVRFRAQSSPIWHDIPSGQTQLAAGDEVFTGADGTAALTLPEGSLARILPNSLVVVQAPVQLEAGSGGSWFDRLKRALPIGPKAPPVPPVVNVTRGRISLSLKKGAAPIQVRSQSRSFQIAAQSEDSAVEIDIDPDRKGDPLRFIGNKSSKVEIRQEQASSGAPAKTFELLGDQEVALDSSHDEMVVRPITQEAPKPAPTKEPEAIAWVIPTLSTPPAPEPSASPASPALTISELKPSAEQAREIPALPRPALKSPADELSFAAKKGVVFAWERVERAAAYQIQVSRSGSFEAPELDEKVKINAHGYTPMAAGAYAWRVRAVDAEGKESGWSEVRRLKIGDGQEESSLLPPLPKTPANDARLPAGKDVVLIWRQTSETPAYHLQVSRDSKFARIVLEQDCKANLQSLKAPKAGKYFWRIKSVTGARSSDWSYVYSFTVQ